MKPHALFRRPGAVQLVVLLQPLQRLRREIRLDTGHDARVERAGRHLHRRRPAVPSSPAAWPIGEGRNARRSGCRTALAIRVAQLRARSLPASPDAGWQRQRQRHRDVSGGCAVERPPAPARSPERAAPRSAPPPAVDVEPRRDRHPHRLAGGVDHVRMLGEAADAGAHRSRARPGVAPDRRGRAQPDDVRRSPFTPHAGSSSSSSTARGAAGAQLGLQRDDRAFELLHLEVARQRGVPHQRDAREVRLEDHGVQLALLVKLPRYRRRTRVSKPRNIFGRLNRRSPRGRQAVAAPPARHRAGTPAPAGPRARTGRSGRRSRPAAAAGASFMPLVAVGAGEADTRLPVAGDGAEAGRARPIASTSRHASSGYSMFGSAHAVQRCSSATAKPVPTGLRQSQSRSGCRRLRGRRRRTRARTPAACFERTGCGDLAERPHARSPNTRSTFCTGPTRKPDIELRHRLARRARRRGRPR